MAFAFRNGPIEDIHAGKACPYLQRKTWDSRRTQEEIETLMKAAVDRVYMILYLREAQRPFTRRSLRGTIEDRVSLTTRPHNRRTRLRARPRCIRPGPRSRRRTTTSTHC